jgi:DNA-binding CsgD family transcriptional regulator
VASINEQVERTLRTLLLAFRDVHNLSDREAETVALALTGLRTKEIASTLGCAPQTIATYWDRVYRKTNSNSKEMVLALVIRFIVETAVTESSDF